MPIIRDDGSFSLGSGVSKYVVNIFGDVKAVDGKDLDKVIRELRGVGGVTTHSLLIRPAMKN